MARPATITDAQILDAARTLFLEKGIQATTAEVARKAGIAEGSIFKRFPTKHELFMAAMAPTLEEPEFLRTLAERVGRGDLRHHLYEVGMLAVAFFRRLLPLMMMSWSNRGPGELPPHLAQPNSPPLRALKRLAAYLEAEMRARRLRRCDPEILSRAFLGGLQNYVFFELLMKANDELPLPAEMHVRGLVAILWNGVAPASGKKG
jgi:AcrR family transcriptional regulator